MIYHQRAWRFPRGASSLKSPWKESADTTDSSAWCLCGQGRDHPGKLITGRAQTSQITAQHFCGSVFGQRWTQSWALPCRNENLATWLKALWKSQISALQQWKSKNSYKELLGMEHRAEIIIASFLTSSIREQEGKGEDDIYERQLNTKTLPPAQGSTKLWITANQVNLLGGNCPAPPPQCYYQPQRHNTGKRNLSLTWRFCHFFSLFFFSRAGAFKIALQLHMKAKDSNDTLGDPSQHPLKPGEGTHRKWDLIQNQRDPNLNPLWGQHWCAFGFSAAGWCLQWAAREPLTNSSTLSHKLRQL